MATNAELAAEVAELKARLREAEIANAQLHRNAGAAGEQSIMRQPSFGMSAGEALELELHGRSTSPFTGKTTTRDEPADDEPDGDE